MLNLFICRKCESSLSEERNTNIDLHRETERSRNKQIDYLFSPNDNNNNYNNKPMIVRSRVKINHRTLSESNPNMLGTTTRIQNETDDQSDLIVIDYPYQKQINYNNNSNSKHNNQHAYIKKGFMPTHIPQVHDDAICDKTDEMDYTLIDDLSDDSGVLLPHCEKYCIYCEEIYKEAFRKGNCIQEKICIYCNRLISQKTYNEIFHINNQSESDNNTINDEQDSLTPKEDDVAHQAKMIKAKSVCRLSMNTFCNYNKNGTSQGRVREKSIQYKKNPCDIIRFVHKEGKEEEQKQKVEKIIKNNNTKNMMNRNVNISKPVIQRNNSQKLVKMKTTNYMKTKNNQI